MLCNECKSRYGDLYCIVPTNKLTYLCFVCVDYFKGAIEADKLVKLPQPNS